MQQINFDSYTVGLNFCVIFLHYNSHSCYSQWTVLCTVTVQQGTVLTTNCFIHYHSTTGNSTNYELLYPLSQYNWEQSKLRTTLSTVTVQQGTVLTTNCFIHCHSTTENSTNYELLYPLSQYTENSTNYELLYALSQYNREQYKLRTALSTVTVQQGTVLTTNYYSAKRSQISMNGSLIKVYPAWIPEYWRNSTIFR